MTSFGSVPAACRQVTISERSKRFLSFSVPDETSLDHQHMLAARLLQIGIQRADAKVGFFQRDEPLEVIVLSVTSADASFMNGGRDCVLFCHRSP
jgi:hypothetical protein